MLSAMQLFGDVPFRPPAVVILVVGLSISVLIWRPLVRRFSWRPWPTLVALVAISVTLALTLGPGFAEGVTIRQCVPSTRGELVGELRAVAQSSEGLLNLLLLVPLGVAATLATRRPLLVCILVIALPGLIELMQTQIAGRVCSGTDYVENVLGGLAGVAVGAVAGWLVARDDQGD
jgi:VanZ like family